MKVEHPSSAKPKMADGSGVHSPTHLTGHGAPASASGRGNEPMPNTGRILSNNWGAQSLKKLDTVSGAAATGGQSRFVQPTNAATAVVPAPGLGNPRN
jgi:hypothetical protein